VENLKFSSLMSNLLEKSQISPTIRPSNLILLCASASPGFIFYPFFQGTLVGYLPGCLSMVLRIPNLGFQESYCSFFIIHCILHLFDSFHTGTLVGGQLPKIIVCGKGLHRFFGGMDGRITERVFHS